MEYIVLVLVVALFLSAVLFKIASSFGGIRPFFAKELKEDRATLSGARKKAKKLTQAASKEMKDAEALVAHHQKAFDARVRAISDEYESWANPKEGKSLLRLGKVTLFEHAIRTNGEMYSLEGLTVDSRITDMSAIIILSLPNGMKISESFDTAWRDGATKYNTKSHNDYDILESTTEKKRSFSPDQIIHMCGEIHNQIIRHADFLNRRPQMIELLAQKVEQEKTERTDLDLAISAQESREATSAIAQESKSAAEDLIVAEAKYMESIKIKLTRNSQ